jgi:hypothetical protein
MDEDFGYVLDIARGRELGIVIGVLHVVVVIVAIVVVIEGDEVMVWIWVVDKVLEVDIIAMGVEEVVEIAEEPYEDEVVEVDIWKVVVSVEI